MRYLTLAAPFQYEADPIKGSRFLAVLTPAADEEVAMAAVRAVEAAHSDAEHVCFAYRLRSGKTRIWDGAEPRGSAGRPILAQLEGHEVFDLVAVVVRWFGGVKLGVGGLARAYGGAAGMALDRAELREVATKAVLSIRCGYPDASAVRAEIARAGGTVASASFDEDTTLEVHIDEALADALMTALRDRTRGRAQRLEATDAGRSTSRP